MSGGILCSRTLDEKMERVPVELRRRKRRVRLLILSLVALVLVGGVIVRISQARGYMQEQIVRLSAEGKGSYEITGYRFVVFSERKSTRSYVLSITVIAKEVISTDEDDDQHRRHQIEIDYPWFPLLGQPTHRI